MLKQIGSEDLVRALETVGRGDSMLDPAVTQQVFQRVRENARRAEDETFATLTDQELNILALITEGLTNKEIAAQVFLSEKTVRNYVSSILNKLNLASRAKLRPTLCATTFKIICPNDLGLFNLNEAE